MAIGSRVGGNGVAESATLRKTGVEDPASPFPGHGVPAGRFGRFPGAALPTLPLTPIAEDMETGFRYCAAGTVAAAYRATMTAMRDHA